MSRANGGRHRIEQYHGKPLTPALASSQHNGFVCIWITTVAAAAEKTDGFALPIKTFSVLTIGIETNGLFGDPLNGWWICIVLLVLLLMIEYILLIHSPPIHCCAFGVQLMACTRCTHRLTNPIWTLNTDNWIMSANSLRRSCCGSLFTASVTFSASRMVQFVFVI